MRILVTGASGLIGRALAPALSGAGHEVIPLRRVAGAPAGDAPWWDPEAGQIELRRATPLDAVVHLAGEPVAQRWTAAAKDRIRRSRCEGTALLAAALGALPQPPSHFLCASAIGFYGDRGEEELDENSPAGTGFLAEVTSAWEAAAQPAAAGGFRVVHLRFGIVLSTAGGALRAMLPAFKLGLGGRVGDGRQFWSWIGLDDAVAAVGHALNCATVRGPVNVVSPRAVRNREFATVLGAVLRRPTLFTVPRVAVRCLLGEMGRELILGSCRVRPAALLATGFSFRQPQLEEVFSRVLHSARSFP